MRVRYKIVPHDSNTYFVYKKVGLFGGWHEVRSYCPWRPAPTRFSTIMWLRGCFESLEEAHKVIEEDKEKDRQIKIKQRQKESFRRKNPPIYLC